MKDIKEELINLIENNKIEEAINLLKAESAKRGGQMDHIIISLSSRYKRYRERSLMGLEAREQEFTQIVSDALQLVKAFDHPAQAAKLARKETDHSSGHRSAYAAPAEPVKPSGGMSNKLIQIGIGALAVIGLLAVIGIFIGGEENDPENTVGNTTQIIESNNKAAGADTNMNPENNNQVATNPVVPPEISKTQETSQQNVNSGQPLTEVSDQLLASQLVGYWQNSFYDEYGNNVVNQATILANGAVQVDTYMNGIFSTQYIGTWGVQEGYFWDYNAQTGFYNKYKLEFQNNNTFILTFSETNGAYVIPVGTQLLYARTN